MAKPRSGTSYRLSEDAQGFLTRLAARLGITKTGVLEVAIRKLAYAELGEHQAEQPSKAAEQDQETASMARCQLIRYDGEEAECVVFLEGFELPRVSFPAWLLRQKGIGIGEWFLWIVRDQANIGPADIASDSHRPDEMTAAERAELERLYEEFQRGLAEDGGKWPVYTGPGK
jgi:hypothetical protein